MIMLVKNSGLKSCHVEIAFLGQLLRSTLSNETTKLYQNVSIFLNSLSSDFLSYPVVLT